MTTVARPCLLPQLSRIGQTCGLPCPPAPTRLTNRTDPTCCTHLCSRSGGLAAVTQRPPLVQRPPPCVARPAAGKQPHTLRVKGGGRYLHRRCRLGNYHKSSSRVGLSTAATNQYRTHRYPPLRTGIGIAPRTRIKSQHLCDCQCRFCHGVTESESRGRSAWKQNVILVHTCSR